MFKKIALVFGSIIAFLSLAIFATPAFAQTNYGWRGFFRGGDQESSQSVIFGTVSSINGSTLVVKDSRSGAVYTVNATGAAVIKDGKTSTLSDISSGDNVMVQGAINGTTVAAKNIRDGVLGRGPEKFPGIAGTVTAVSGTTITISSRLRTENASATSYTIDASNATITKDGATSSISNISVGDVVFVEGTLSGDNVIATVIQDGAQRRNEDGGNKVQAPIIQGNGEPIVAGNVTALSGTTITITNKGNITYTIDASNATVTKDGATSSISSVAVGDSIIVQGTVNGTSVVASTIIDQSKPTPSTFPTTAGRFHSLGFVNRIVSFFRNFFGF